MNICFVIGQMKFSGAEKVLSLLATKLVEENNEVHVILLQSDYSESSIENGVKLHGAKSEGNKLTRSLKRYKNIRKLTKEIKPDVVVSFGYVCNINTLISLMGLKVNKIICERNDPNYDPADKTMRILRKLLYRFSTGYVFQTKRISECFSKKIQSKCTIIANPIIDSGNRWSEENADKKMVTTARLDNYQKDHITLFKAFAEFSKDNPDYTLEIYGDGPDKEFYLNEIENLSMKDKILLMGRTNNSIEKIMAAQVYVLTSVFEGMPNSLIEAMSIGMPCISTDCGGGGAKALYEYDEGVILVPVGDKDALVAQMKRLTSEKDLRLQLSQKAVHINEHLSLDKITNKWIEYLKQFA